VVRTHGIVASVEKEVDGKVVVALECLKMEV
jgi:hypothetical protein